MIPAIRPDRQPASWQRIMTDAISRPQELLTALQLPDSLLPAAEAAARLFPLRVPRPYLQRMTAGDPRDPLLLQVLPLHAEHSTPAGFIDDPVGDLDAMKVPGLLHKYHGRVLLITTGACAIHCRYCFRRHFPYSGGQLGGQARAAALAYIRADRSISEVILSGGDPLSLSDGKLAALAADLDGIPHLQRLRIHTRQPIVLPQRVDDRLTDWMSSSRLKIVMVVHANHPQELDSQVGEALREVSRCGVQLLNQSVLLKGINDDSDTLAELSETLLAYGVLPYYLHLLDPVRGAAHFQLDRSDAVALHQRLRDHLPGYLVPRLVTEIAGRASKTSVYNHRKSGSTPPPLNPPERTEP